MKRQQSLFSKRGICVAAVILAVMMLVGSFFDYQISCALYNESNPFGITFAAYGEIPATLGFSAAGMMLLLAHNKEKKLIGVLQCIAGALLVAMGTLSICFMPTIYLSWPKPVVAVVGIILDAVVIFFVVRLSKKADRGEMIRVASMLFFVIFAEMMIINIIKVPWGRARMRLVANDARAYFMPWWQAGDTLKSTLVAAGVAAEEFKSFPSGHTGNATVMIILLGLLPRLSSKLEGKEHVLAWCGFAWACIVAFSRIIMGAHYLTDTTVGFTVGFLCILLFEKLVFRRKEK